MEKPDKFGIPRRAGIPTDTAYVLFQELERETDSPRRLRLLELLVQLAVGCNVSKRKPGGNPVKRKKYKARAKKVSAADEETLDGIDWNEKI